MKEIDIDTSSFNSIKTKIIDMTSYYYKGKSKINELQSDIPKEALNYNIEEVIQKYHQAGNKLEEVNNNAIKLAAALGDTSLAIKLNQLSQITVEMFDYNNIKEEGFTPQGYTLINGNIAVTAYSKEGKNSRIYMYNGKTGKYEGYIELTNTAHVGGITYDKKENILYVTGSNGKINSYNYSIISKAIDEIKKSSHYKGQYMINLNDQQTNSDFRNVLLSNNIDLDELINNKDAATCYYYKDKLYVSTYTGSGSLIAYDLTVDKKKKTITANPTIISNDLPGAVQGIAFYHEKSQTGKEKDYIVVSRSGALSRSELKKYEITDTGLSECKGTIVIEQKGLEGITITEDGMISGIFEYGNTKSLGINLSEFSNSQSSIDEKATDISLKTQGNIWPIKEEIKRTIQAIFSENN